MWWKNNILNPLNRVGGMVMKHFRFVAPLMVILGLALILTACNEAPWVMRFDAKQASLAADAALARGADKAAPAEYSAAMAILDKANAMVKEGKFTPSIKVYKEAKVAFDKASFATMTEAEKKAVIAETNKKIASLEESWKKLEPAAAQSKKKAAFDADSKSFAQGIAQAKGTIATDTIGAKAKAEALKAVYDKWDYNFRPLIPLKKS